MTTIIGNWKLAPQTKEEALALVKEIIPLTKEATKKGVFVGIAPPSLFLDSIHRAAKGVSLGAQDAWEEPTGAYTGETSPISIKNIGASFVILGHSERRAKGESDALVSRKVLAALKAGLSVVVCVGERERDEDGVFFRTIATMLEGSLAGIPKGKINHLTIAYEPIWAIGKNALRAATPEDHREVAVYIKKTLVGMFGQGGTKIPVLYGGSVDEKNAAAFLRSGADGLLVGRASLVAKKFTAIIHAALV